MKKTLLILFCILTASCSSTTTYNIDEEMADFAKNDVYENDADRYRQNVAVKEQGDTFVVYEYKDIRIDELAPLAIRYCEDKEDQTNAVLREIVLYRNHLRRATFDCKNLAKSE